MSSNDSTNNDLQNGRAVVSLHRWMEQVGVVACTVWRWRRKGWLETINIAGRQYLTQTAIDEFHRRAVAGEFAQKHKTPARKTDFPAASPSAMGEPTDKQDGKNENEVIR